jgi:MOSC domain-containing protein YiiM
VGPLTSAGRCDGAVTCPRVVAVCRDELHRFSKTPVERITPVTGLGVAGDAHAGTTVQPRSRVRRDPQQPNLRQVHLLHAELFEQVAAAGYRVGPDDLGENLTTAGVPLLDLPAGTRLHLAGPVVQLTRLRNPCHQIDEFQPGLLKMVVARADRVVSPCRTADLRPRRSAEGVAIVSDP